MHAHTTARYCLMERRVEGLARNSAAMSCSKNIERSVDYRKSNFLVDTLKNYLHARLIKQSIVLQELCCLHRNILLPVSLS